MTTRPGGHPVDAGRIAEGVLARITAEALFGSGLADAEEARVRIAEVRVMAEEWGAGRLPLAEVGRLCTSRERFLAVRFGSRPIPAALLALVDAFLDAVPGPDGYCYRTRFGIFTEADVAANDGSYRREAAGRIAIVFPLTVERAMKEKDGWR